MFPVVVSSPPPAANFACAAGPGGLASFPAPVLHDEPDAVLYLRVPGVWHELSPGSAPCVVVVPRPEDCTAAAFPAGAGGSSAFCAARPLWELGRPSLAFELPRPRFTMGFDLQDAPDSHTVCARRSLRATPHVHQSEAEPHCFDSGRLAYYPRPRIRFFRPQSVHGLVLHVRTFLNPGWRQEILLDCVNCSSVNRIALQPLPAEHPHCEPAGDDVAAAAFALQKEDYIHALEPGGAWPKTAWSPAGKQSASSIWAPGQLCPPPPGGPCRGFVEDSFALGELEPGQRLAPSGALAAHEATFIVESRMRMKAGLRRTLFKRKTQICFYPDESSPQGWLAGYVEMRVDAKDVQSFVGFVVFFVLALPLLCMITALMHMSKHGRCDQQVRTTRSEFQRQQLQSEMSERRGIRQAAVALTAGAPLEETASEAESASGSASAAEWRPSATWALLRVPERPAADPTADAAASSVESADGAALLVSGVA